MKTLFHLSFNVTDLAIARAFYVDVLGCTEGRSADTWVDFSFYEHQLSLHLGDPFPTHDTGRVGNYLVPMPHFGIVLPYADWVLLSERLTQSGLDFVIPPHHRFPGQAGEQWAMFFRDPCGNPIEVKGFKDLASVFSA